ncbi:K channel inward rectifier conserved region 2 domain protein [Reticulomyxa filosa]|uniref:K channel inward rectifier conserved region 2 domain protein n=1 Tax=Reticulomyxa filosa TaxID=46433 RepID=X6NVS9_RETFI|nr:K channel inward rectifier conserved region 2 domain protein [Reticulomyxa filosa]|eukprot:ETO29924.1 K channel inward rectifier conserved region 2 domain protein [Reticulomyxa filosa]
MSFLMMFELSVFVEIAEASHDVENNCKLLAPVFTVVLNKKIPIKSPLARRKCAFARQKKETSFRALITVPFGLKLFVSFLKIEVGYLPKSKIGPTFNGKFFFVLNALENLNGKKSKTNYKNKAQNPLSVNDQLAIRGSNATTDTHDRVQFRLVSRNLGSRPNIRQKGNLQRLRYVYFQMLDLSWQPLLFYVLITFLFFNVVFATLFYIFNGVVDTMSDSDNVGWATCFYFSLQTMDTIGYGRLLPRGVSGNVLVYCSSYWGTLYWVALAGIVFKKYSRPSRLKRQFLFSDVAVINSVTPSFSRDESIDSHHTEGKYAADCPCFSFRFVHLRPKSRICDSNLNLLLFERTTRDDGYEDYQIHELEFGLNRQLDRLRAVRSGFPGLCMPWTVTHRLDRHSPLYQLTVQDMIRRKMEIICVMDGMDEAAADSFQVWWSYCPQEIVWDFQFVPMVSCIHVKDGSKCRLCVRRHLAHHTSFQIHYQSISLVSPCLSAHLNRNSNTNTTSK